MVSHFPHFAIFFHCKNPEMPFTQINATTWSARTGVKNIPHENGTIIHFFAAE